MKTECVISQQTGKAFRLKKGDCITITDISGKQVVDFFAVNPYDHSEFLSTGVTIDCNESLKVKKGDSIYTNRYHAMFTILEDDCGEHDLIHPCCRKEMYEFLYQNGEGHPNCLDNINGCLEPFEIAPHAIIHPFNIFMRTAIHPDGRISVEVPVSKAGDHIKLLVEMDVVAGIASCSVGESKCNGGACTDILVMIDHETISNP